MGGDLAEPRRRRARLGHFDPEIVSVTVPAHKETDREGNEVDVPETVVTKDDGPRPGTTMEVLGKLKPAFRPDGTVTAGNACPLNDGAAAVLVMSDEKAKRLGLKPKARIVASTVTAIRPEIMGLGPIPAIQALLEQTGVKIDDVDVVEINEAFAAQIVPCKDELGIPDEKLNPFGGAIALGHPFGMTGARIMTTLINGLPAMDGTLGIESMCVAGGMGQAMLIERLSLEAPRATAPARRGWRLRQPLASAERGHAQRRRLADVEAPGRSRPGACWSSSIVSSSATDSATVLIPSAWETPTIALTMCSSTSLRGRFWMNSPSSFT